ncbi:MAG: S8 family serine peptidase [Alphaproteobacteria bacterium]|nr:S8 family serine peptidase [Alphaproteobacteria bacterium]
MSTPSDTDTGGTPFSSAAAPSATTQMLAGYGGADAAVAGPLARATAGVSGAGIRIGILSDSLNVRNGESADIAQGVLPADGVTVLKEGPAGSTDEGRAMAQIIHATAPDAQLYFYSAYYSMQDYAAGIAALVAAGCQIIVDDVAYTDEPFFQVAGPIDSAVAAAVASGVSYFTAAGNSGAAFAQAAWSEGATVTQTVNIPANTNASLTLQWDAPYDAANPPTLRFTATSAGAAPLSSTQVGTAPVAEIDFPRTAAARTYQITITQTPSTPAPSLFKDMLVGGGNFLSAGSGVGSGSIFGHALVPGVNVVGAVSQYRASQPSPEPFSGTGPGELLFASDGTRLATPLTRNAPSFLAPDASATSLLDPFYGTSAAAPVAAAIAALLLQARPSLDDTDITALLQDSAVISGPATVAGAGMIDAQRAVSYARSGVIAGSAQTTVRGLSLACTLAGGSGAHVLIAGSGPTLLQSQGTDTVIAGAGADTVDLTGPAAVLFGAAGPLRVRTLAGADTIIGGARAVTLDGGVGSGIAYGSAAGGNRLTAGAAPTMLVGGGAGDTLIAAGAGEDTLFAPGTGAATLLGTPLGGSIFVAGGGADIIAPGGGTSEVWLGSGAATVLGGTGTMLLGGGSGPALVFGGAAGGNLLFAGEGATTLVGGGLADTLVANGAGDVLIAARGGGSVLFGGTGAETLLGGAAGTNLFGLGPADALVAPGGARAVITFGSGRSTVLAGAGAELFNFVAGEGGGSAVIVNFDPSRDMVRIAGFGAGEPRALATQLSGGDNAALALPDGTRVLFAGLPSLSPSNVVFA